MALSIIEVEFVACSAIAQEAVWLRRFLQELRVVACIFNLMIIHYNNMEVLSYTRDSKYHRKNKYIVKCHYVREDVKQKEVVLEYISMSCIVIITLYTYI